MSAVNVIGRVALHAGGTAGVAVDGHQIKFSASSLPIIATVDEARRIRLLIDTAIFVVGRQPTTEQEATA